MEEEEENSRNKDSFCDICVFCVWCILPDMSLRIVLIYVEGGRRDDL